MYSLNNANLLELEPAVTNNIQEIQILQTPEQNVGNQLSNGGGLFATPDANLVQYIQNPVVTNQLQTIATPDSSSTTLATLTSLQTSSLNSLLDAPSSNTGFNLSDLQVLVQLPDDSGQQYLIPLSNLVLNNATTEFVPAVTTSFQNTILVNQATNGSVALTNQASDVPTKPVEIQSENNAVSTVEKGAGKTADQNLNLSDIIPSLYKTSFNSIHNCTNCQFSTNVQQEYDMHMNWHSLKEGMSENPIQSKPKKEVKRKGRGRPPLNRKQRGAQMKRTGTDESKQTYKCDMCEVELKTLAAHKKHMREHTTEKLFQCTDCRESFNKEHNLRLHKALHFVSPDDGRYQCPECQKYFTRKAGLKMHMTLHAEEETFMCKECGDEFNTKSDLTNHVSEHDVDLQRLITNKNKSAAHAVGNDGVTLQHVQPSLIVESSPARIWPNAPTQNIIPSNTLTNRVVTTTANTTNNVTQNGNVATSITGTATSTNDPMQLSSLFGSNKNSTLLWQAMKSQKTSIKPTSTGHKCESCGKIFQRKSQLLRHERIHTGEKPFKCNVCEKAFNQKGALQTHMYMHSKKKPFTCPHCPQMFAQRGNMRIHIKRVHSLSDSDKTHKCSICSCSFKTAGTLNSHITKYHGGLTDSMAMNMLEISESIKDTQQPEANEQPTVSSLDIESIQSKLEALGSAGAAGDKLESMNQKFLYMWKVRRVDGQRWHQCMFCSKEFRKPSDLVRHIRVHTNERPYKCPECSRAFSIKTSLSSHIKSHLGIRPHKCKVCQKSFVTPSSLKVHERLHTGAKPYKCPHCEKSFRTVSHKSAHLKVHMKQRAKSAVLSDTRNSLLRTSTLPRSIPFHVEEPLVADDNGVLRPTIKKIPGTILANDPDRTFKCKVCKKAFKKSCHLKSHMRSHTGERPYTCQQCKKSFISSGVLKAHMKTHSGVNPYRCNVCSQSFMTFWSLKRHSQSHSEARPYFCPHCHQSFKSIMNCRAHYKRHKLNINMQNAPGNHSSLAGNRSLYSDHDAADPSSLEHYLHQNDDTTDSMQQVDPNMVIPDSSRTNHANHSFLATQDSNVHTREPYNPSDFSDISLSGSDIFQHENNVLHSNDQNNIDDALDFNSFADGISESDISQSIHDANLGLLQSLTEGDGNVVDDNASKDLLEMADIPRQQQIDDLDKTKTKQTNHKEASTSNNDLVYLCPHCNLQSTNLPHLQSHIATHTPGCAIHTCMECSYSFHDRGILQQHIFEQHPNQEQHESVFKKRSARKQKKRTNFFQISEEQGRILAQTKPTDRMTLSERVLLKEITEKDKVSEVVASGRGKIKPPETNGPLHSNVCPHCPKSFAKKSDLERHIRTHTGEKPWKCDKCGKAFNVRSSLVTHQRTHTGISSFRCHICDVMYSSKASLKLHMRVHTGGRPLKCPHCPQQFRTSGFRKSHIRVYHNSSNGKKKGFRKSATTTNEEQVITNNTNEENSITPVEQTQNHDKTSRSYNDDATVQLDTMYTNSQPTTSLPVSAPPNLVIQPISSLGLTMSHTHDESSNSSADKIPQEINIAVPPNIANITQQMFQPSSSISNEASDSPVNATSKNIMQQLQQYLNAQPTVENQHKTAHTNENFSTQEMYANNMQPYTVLLSGENDSSENTTNQQYTLAIDHGALLPTSTS